MKTLYISAWILVLAAIPISVISGTFGAASLVAVSLAVLALVYTLALWSVLSDTAGAHEIAGPAR